MTNREKQAAYRERMYEAGYKQILIWVPRDSENKAVKMDRKDFMYKLEELTAGWSRAKLSRTFTEFLNIIKMKNREVK